MWRVCKSFCIYVQGGTGSPCERLCAKLHSALASGQQKVSSCGVIFSYIYVFVWCKKSGQRLNVDSIKTKQNTAVFALCGFLYRCQGDGWSAYSERTGFHKLLQKQTFESDDQPEKQEQPVNATCNFCCLYKVRYDLTCTFNTRKPREDWREC